MVSEASPVPQVNCFPAWRSSSSSNGSSMGPKSEGHSGGNGAMSGRQHLSHQLFSSLLAKHCWAAQSPSSSKVDMGS